MKCRQAEIRRENGQLLFARTWVPVGFLTRARGLIGRPALAEDEAWWFKACNSIHMLGMFRPIDVVFVDDGGQVLKCVERVMPFGVAGCFRARDTIELAAGAIRRADLRVGERLSLIL